MVHGHSITSGLPLTAIADWWYVQRGIFNQRKNKAGQPRYEVIGYFIMIDEKIDGFFFCWTVPPQIWYVFDTYSFPSAISCIEFTIASTFEI